MGGFCLLVELHQEGSAPAACAAGLFFYVLHCFWFMSKDFPSLMKGQAVQPLPHFVMLFNFLFTWVPFGALAIITQFFFIWLSSICCKR